MNYKVTIKPKILKPQTGIVERFKLFNYTLIEDFDEQPAYLVLYAYLAETYLLIRRNNPAQFLYNRLGNLPADGDMRLHINGIMDSIWNYELEIFSNCNKFPLSASYTFVHPAILFAPDISVGMKARYIKAVKNLSLRRRLVGGKLIVPADYIEESVTGIPGITQKNGKVRFNLEEQVIITEEK